ncbi:MAG: BON domain-containing protein [Alphaproteobacteria bacterium]|nr:MAG: BON domain-containing protein [Alphaproteobacteria bacterium]
MDTDRVIRSNVEAELDFDPSLDAKGIGVAVKGGIVTLTGHVPSFPQVIAAERAAQRVRNVRAVAQDLRVRLPGLFQHADDAIARRAANILKWSVGTAPTIKVSVHAGWVTLSGEVEWGFEKQEAERMVRRLGGVIGVSNTITVKPKIRPVRVKAAITAALKRHAELEGSAINVAVEGSTVTLSGKVNAWRERKMAENAAWAIPGVTEVRDQITLA